MGRSESISVIIPAFDEESVIAGTIEAVRGLGECEVVIVDGGSADRTVELASPLADRVVSSPKGRGVQLRTGAGESSGGILLFMHADCRLPHGAFGRIREALSVPGVAAGAFDLEIGHDAFWARAIGAAANFRSRLFRMPYGDQGLFMLRGVYDEAGGYRPMRLMEDVEFSVRLRQMGRIALLRERMTSSPRRWLSEGVLRTTLKDWALMVSYFLGVSPERLARMYGDAR